MSLEWQLWGCFDQRSMDSWEYNHHLQIFLSNTNGGEATSSVLLPGLYNNFQAIVAGKPLPTV